MKLSVLILIMREAIVAIMSWNISVPLIDMMYPRIVVSAPSDDRAPTKAKIIVVTTFAGIVCVRHVGSNSACDSFYVSQSSLTN